MKYLLDTAVYSQPLRNRPDQTALERWQKVGFDQTAVSVISEAEILSGLYAEGGEQRFLYYQNTLSGRIRVLHVDESVARLFARLKARQTKQGQPMAENRLLIAATAQAHGLTVATLGDCGMEKLEGVKWEDWSGMKMG